MEIVIKKCLCQDMKEQAAVFLHSIFPSLNAYYPAM